MTLNYQRKVSLQAYNSLAVPATAAMLIEVNSVDDLTAAISYANASELRILVLGEGSNTLFVSDFDGLVILNRIIGVEVLSETAQSVTLRVGAGENWHELVRHAMAQQWYGLENLALIPGLVGAAPIQNIGAYGVELKDAVVEVQMADLVTGRSRALTNQQCEFGYRDSIFKHELASKVVISSVVFKLSRSADVNIVYPALAKRFADIPSPEQVFEAVCDIRSSKLPSPNEIPNAGSFFKNPLLSNDQHQELQLAHPGLVSFKLGNQYKLAAAWLIEHAGWKNKSLDGVTVHKDQALVIINPERRRGSQVLEFAQRIQHDIKRKYGVELEIEPRVVQKNSPS